MRAMLASYEKDILRQLERMNDPDCSVQRDAICALTGVKDARVLYPFIRALQNGDIGVQQAAMDALAAFEDEVAVYNVLPLLSDKRVYVRSIAKDVLEKIGIYGTELFRCYMADKDEDVRKMIADILGNIKSHEARELLIEMLKDPCSNVRSSAAAGLGRIGDPSIIDSLIGLLSDDEWVAFFAIESLRRIRDKKAIEPLTRLIDSSNIDLQIVALNALGEIGGEKAMYSLMKVVNSERPQTVNTAVKALVKLMHGNIERVLDGIGIERFFNYLTGAVNEIAPEELDVKVDFIHAFSIIRNHKSSAYILRLISGVEMDNMDILQTATDALEGLGDEDTLIRALKDNSNICVLIAIRVLGLLKSNKAVPNLKNIFEKVDRDIRIEILLALGNIGGGESLDFLTGMLSYAEGHIRGAAARSLGILASSEAIGLLLNKLKQEEYQDVIEEIVNALVSIGQRHTIPSLCEDLASNLTSKKPHIREMVIKGLANLGWTKVNEHARRMISDEYWRVRKACLEVLSNLKASGFLDILITAASDEKDEIRILVAQLAGEYTEKKAVDILISLFSDRNNRVICKAIEGLLKLKAAEAIPYLIEFARREAPFVQKTAIWALGELAAKEAESILKTISCHHNPEIRDSAIESYRKIKIRENVIQ